MVSGSWSVPGKGFHLACAVGVFHKDTGGQLLEEHCDAGAQPPAGALGAGAGS